MQGANNTISLPVFSFPEQACMRGGVRCFQRGSRSRNYTSTNNVAGVNRGGAGIFSMRYNFHSLLYNVICIMFDRIINYGITISTPFFSPILPCSFLCTTSHSLLAAALSSSSICARLTGDPQRDPHRVRRLTFPGVRLAAPFSTFRPSFILLPTRHLSMGMVS